MHNNRNNDNDDCNNNNDKDDVNDDDDEEDEGCSNGSHEDSNDVKYSSKKPLIYIYVIFSRLFEKICLLKNE